MNSSTAPSGLPSDLTDERLTTYTGLRGTLRGATDRLRSGDLGALPVIIGLVVISVIFQTLNPIFLSSQNLSNLLMDASPVGILALGIVMVLLVGQIDLSVGSVSGFSAAVLAVLFVNNHLPLGLTLVITIAIGVAIGYLYGVIFTRIGIPSFVVTLSGLLAFLGLQLFVLGPTGSINLPYDSPLVTFGQLAFVPKPVSYVFAVVIGVAYFLLKYLSSRSRRRAGLSGASTTGLVVQAAVMTVVLLAIAAYMNQARGFGWMFVVFVVLVLAADYALRSTRWGRNVFAVGGNKEAARRAGINVNWTFTTTFMICSALGAFGGILAAGRLASAATSSGGGDTNLNAIAAAVIGGTSLFGGRGSAISALLGVLVIAAISSGLTLLNLDSSIRYFITGVVVLIAVGVDAIARRSRASHGRA
ncbi:sugar ABC transporter permease [Curtobacterium sp. RRHDQ10]|uniref:sugar ABC transporter permease n=1 Tax=Curtobacterium phyllosphaerae TaxID=3413379 RepID=UPI003BF00411